MKNLLDVPGVAALRGKGVWLEMPDEVPASLRDGHAVVIGDVETAATAALQLHEGGCRVTVLATGFSATDVRTLRRAVRGRAGIDVRLNTELACVDGIDHVEALVMRRRGCRCVDACNASAVFILNAQEKHL
jgi:thioredoxin reductase